MNSLQHQLERCFSDYRADWEPQVYQTLFIPPPYFDVLSSPRPCVLIGGRGTGKTTALRSLCVESADSVNLESARPDARGPAFLGAYVLLNKNKVTAISPELLGKAGAQSAFKHYLNLVCLKELTRRVLSRSPQANCDSKGLRLVAQALGTECTTLDDFSSRLTEALVQLELYVNNFGSVQPPLFSFAETPIRLFVDALKSDSLYRDVNVYLCLDEYENLSDWQQAVANTYIKHAGDGLFYKIGVRRNGIRTRRTIDSDDVLRTPDDYLEIEIAAENFEEFAVRVIERRLSTAVDHPEAPQRIDQLLPGLSQSDEALLLGARRVSERLRQVMTESGDAPLAEWGDRVDDAVLYFAEYWAANENRPVLDVLRSWRASPDEWKNRINNHGYASLFWLSLGHKGQRTKKYYCGGGTYLALASGNIRYFIELIYEAVRRCPKDSSWMGSVDPKEQTEAARYVGQRRLEQIDEMSESGDQVKRLVLGLGRVFFELARQPLGHAPEVASFVLSGAAPAMQVARRLLDEGVGSLAFEVTPSTKPTSHNEPREDEFRLHPIFTAFFAYSHRKKRRMTIDSENLLLLTTRPRKAIEAMIKRDLASSDDLPIQLALFSDFYESDEGGNA